MGKARFEASFAYGDVIAAVANGVLGQDAGNAMGFSPSQCLMLGGEYPACEGGSFAVEDPNGIHRLEFYDASRRVIAIEHPSTSA